MATLSFPLGLCVSGSLPIRVNCVATFSTLLEREKGNPALEARNSRPVPVPFDAIFPPQLTLSQFPHGHRHTNARKISTSVSTQWAFVTLLKGAWHLESRVTGSYQRWDLGKRGLYSPLLLCVVVPPQLTERRVWLEVRGRGSCLLCRGLEGRSPVGPGGHTW